jgi:signal transduction histidine kinase
VKRPPQLLLRSFDFFIRRPAWWPLLILFWALVTAASYAWHIHELEQHAHTMAAMRGRLVFEMVETTRLWAANHGGVYAPVTAANPPNPWLDVPEKSVTTPAGVLLTLINPAYMTRQLNELISTERDMRVRQTSLNPINPANLPDPWERESLERFATSRAERISIVGAGATAIFRYMAPLEIRESCIACHVKQSYALGEVSGGISVSFPASYIYAIIDAQKRGFMIIHLAVFAIFGLLAWASLLVTRRNLLALEAVRGDLVESEKMASLGRMVAGFAHEVNTPVGIAVGAASQSRELVAELGRLIDQPEVSEDDLRQRLQMLGEASTLTLDNLRRAAGMVQSFKRTSVDQTSEAEREFDLAEVIDDVLTTLRNVFKTTQISISVDCPHDIRLFGAAGALQQLLTNLLQNSHLHAYDNGSGAGQIHIRAQAANGRVRLEFSDDGAGMDAATLEHAFEPFFTTRRGSGGSGLGLYIAYNMATQGLGGSIGCDSRPGQGTRFVIEFPVHRAAREAAEHEDHSQAAGRPAP